ncbi:Stk1 family PASTA domain-containing Ser/Thr kinase [Ectobacillus sp. JY-23]|uniref:Stk1 family PASTA domain-containing Ser/Thr kinase n=1 Tax=Ectobacillus sp. JY-23 TaxID=2933872 RepID=UPI001FF4A502|nr:Stk1 family PASTA domain-containing Ser/Thr kinase [Ectobacillus sp. JY-23]UOY93683.1 Stk1 family PASTA domain-containing Ser/Thr kinase [Ectobacillus sp. JY-23]
MMIGKRLNGRYKLLKMIGGGGMANVFLARDAILDRDVAVKILRLDYANNEEFIKRFHREAQSVTSLSHPNIVNIYDVGEEDGIYYLVMEYVPGQTLKQYIQQKGMLPVAEALHIMKQLTSAMAHAHHFEIVHRDLKPQNILIRDDATVKVTDFGIATATSATTITHTNSVLGSVHYLSPEQARGGIANKQSDLYSLGIVMFELLTGRPPFSGESAVSIALKHLQNETPSPKRWNPNIPQSVENIILRATAKDPFHRYQSGEEMENDIVTALNPERINEQPFSVPQDEDATKQIPIIREELFVKTGMDETIVNTGKLPVEVKSEEKSQAKPKKNWWKRVFIVLFLLLLSGIAAVTVIPGLFVPKNVEIPDVAGETYADAVNILSKKGFQVASTPEIVYTDEVTEGEVIKTSPEAGRVVKENTKITIFQSGGKKKKKMKNYIGESYETVRSELDSTYASVVSYAQVSDKPKGEIIDQLPKSGEFIVEEEQDVRIWISEGPKRVTLADFTGWTESSVRSYAAERKLTPVVTKENSETVDKGLVTSQSPKPNTPLKEGERFTVIISDGPKEKPPKTVAIDNIQVPYEPEVPGQAQTIEIYKEDLDNTMAKPVETRTITAPVTISLKLTVPYGKSARYKIVRDGKTFIEKDVPYPYD